MAAGCEVTDATGRALAGAPVLSVCIPTYNFGAFIEETLLSVLTQTMPGVEVVVFDSASVDDTAAVVARLQSQYPVLRYVRAEGRGGIDRDMARVVDLAHGTYCWLFSADDVMASGAIERVLAELATQDDLYLCLHSNHSIAMELIDRCHPVLRSNVDRRYDLSDREQQLQYFAQAQTTEAFFSFMGGLIVRRSVWCSVPLNERFVGSCWAHAARLFELVTKGLSVKFLATVLLHRRGGNDAFAAEGQVRRYALAIQGYQQLGDHFWGRKSTEAFHIRRVLRNEYSLRMFLSVKLLCATNPSGESRQLLNTLVASIYSDLALSCVIKRVAFHGFPLALLQPARKVYRYLRGKRGASSS